MTTRRGPAPLLITQVAVPAPPAGIVPRPRLAELLQRGLAGPTTLVCAPAGSGKTSLLSAELGRDGVAPPAWVSLGPGDDDPGRLWGTVLAALSAAGVVLDGSALDALAPPVRASRRGFMPLLVNALAELEEPVVLVLDDLHLVRSRECLAELAFLILHAPASLRLVLSTRSDPALPLHLLRVRGQLVEIRSADLAFTDEEAARLLSTHGVTLSGDLVRMLTARTEGWGAGLRLAALSLQHHEDPERFVAEFAGDDRAVGDYLLAEVLDSQPPRLRRFLLRTAIVERICGELADVLTGGDSGADALAELELTNGFVIALDSRREWYRYHRLFATLLRIRARAELGGELRELHRRAALWCAAHGEQSQALWHSVQAEDWELCAQIAADHWFDLFVHGQGGALRMLADVLPPERLENDAELAAAMACTALESGEPEAARAYLTHAERAESCLSPERRGGYLTTVAIARIYLASSARDLQAAVRAADGLLPETEHAAGRSSEDRRALVHASLGEAALGAHMIDRARAELSEAARLAEANDLEFVLVGVRSQLSLIALFDDGPDQASEMAREALELAERRGWAAIPSMSYARAAMAYVALSADMDPDVALAHVERAVELASSGTRPIRVPLAHLTARIQLARGDAVAGLRTLDRIEIRREGGKPSPFELAELACMRARLHATRGDLPAAREVVDSLAGLDCPPLSVVRARLLLADGAVDDAVALLGEARDAMPDDGDLLTSLEIDTLLAIAHDGAGSTADAATAVERALAVSERTGHRWAFLEAGRRMEALLRAQIRAGTAHRAVAGELIAAFEDRRPVRAPVAPLLEPLSDREQAILRYLPTTLSNREIASELFVTTNTVKTHLRSIYRKLDVAKRRDAVDRARELRMLGSGLGRY